MPNQRRMTRCRNEAPALIRELFTKPLTQPDTESDSLKIRQHNRAMLSLESFFGRMRKMNITRERSGTIIHERNIAYGSLVEFRVQIVMVAENSPCIRIHPANFGSD